MLLPLRKIKYFVKACNTVALIFDITFIEYFDWTI